MTRPHPSTGQVRHTLKLRGVALRAVEYPGLSVTEPRYLTNFQVYPHLEHHPLMALAASLGVGILYWKATDYTMSWFARRRAHRSV